MSKSERNARAIAELQSLLQKAERLVGAVDLSQETTMADTTLNLLSKNVDNDKLSDAEFRELVRTSLKVAGVA
ncbi:endoribonuclease YbeY [Novimethylophilus kurashikiensis]|uniref:Endoribonuclease YbeY n=1 Tax=Novimethylophilus kurashikiensis TaxID=1825523 RepID=A0A2R5FE25_9PROT|nr:hypothetical protein [Novimethylophilus kurashikiensis]GBG14821.1 endoribonuclease YbeY [Novimethylophilus kurashikiensis]